MSIEQNIIDAVEVSKLTKIPVLFMSNPGLGKTTILTRYAKHFNYHLETLIGSRFTPEEISGYQVNNGGNHLEHLNPEWFNRILEKSKAGIRTLLFIDELSTCSEFVQGALLSLIFDRCIGNNKMLPEDCFIIAAANYAQNLPSSMGIMAPTLNRFIIVNLNDDYNAFNLLDEFLTTPEKPVYPSIVRNFEPNYVELFNKKLKEEWKNIFIKYSDPKSSTGYLDIANHALNEIYTTEGSVYNFISGRTLSYLSRVLICCKKLSLTNYDIIEKMISGLVGAGTCQFSSEEQGVKYRKYLCEKFITMINNNKTTSTQFLPMTRDISKDVAAFITNLENVSFSEQFAKEQLNTIVSEVITYFNLDNLTEHCDNITGVTKFVSNMESLFELRNKLNSTKRYKEYTPLLLKTLTEFYALYCDVNNLTVDYEKKFGIKCKLKIQLYKIKTSINGKNKYNNMVMYTAPNHKTGFSILTENETLLNLQYQNIKNLSRDNQFEIMMYNKINKCFDFVPVQKYMGFNII